MRDQYDKGADPATVLGDLAEFTHFVTRVKVAPALAEDASLTEQERTRGRDFAAKLSMRVLARTWQMLLKGIAEVQEAGRPLAAAEMVLVRIAYAADLPTPDEAIRLLADAPMATARGQLPRLKHGASSTCAIAARRRPAQYSARGVGPAHSRPNYLQPDAVRALPEIDASKRAAWRANEFRGTRRARRRKARSYDQERAGARRAAGAF